MVNFSVSSDILCKVKLLWMVELFFLERFEDFDKFD